MFVDESSKVDRKALQEFTLKELTELKKISDYLLYSKKYDSFWQLLHKRIISLSDDNQKLVQVENQLAHLSGFIEDWISTAVDTSERFEFYVRVKAEEIASGDEKRDYFWALQIRHDQLVALIKVLTMLIERMCKWVKMEPVEVTNDPVFLGITNCSLEEQIYLEAEEVARKREKLIRH